MFDALFYQDFTKQYVLKLLNKPSLEERQERRILGVVWSPGQSSPLDGPKIPIWTLVYGNILGVEKDPATLIELMDFEFIQPGLIGGRYKPNALDTDRHRERVEKQRFNENALKGPKNAQERTQTVYEDEDALVLDYLQSVALVMNVRNPERMTFDQLLQIQRLALVTDARFDDKTMHKFIDRYGGKSKTVVIQEEEQELNFIDIDTLEDWEVPFKAAYSSVAGGNKTKVR